MIRTRTNTTRSGSVLDFQTTKVCSTSLLFFFFFSVSSETTLAIEVVVWIVYRQEELRDGVGSREALHWWDIMGHR